MPVPSFNAWRAQSGTPSTPVAPGGGSPAPTPGGASRPPSFRSWSSSAGVTLPPPGALPTPPPDRRSTFGKISDTGGNLAASFVTGLGTSTGRILDQIFHLGTKALEQKESIVDLGLGAVEKGLDKIGVDSSGVKKAKDFELAKKIDSYRLKFKENLLGGADIARETNPMADTFAGQTAEVIGGVVPQVALAFAKVPQAALALSESVMNAEDSYDKNIKAGMDQKEAMKRALPQLAADLAGTYLTNKFGAIGKFGGTGKTAFKSIIAESLKDSALEIVQEVWQTGLQNLATDKPFTEGMGETAKLTIIPALLFGAAGNIGSIQAQKQTKEKVSQAVAVMNEKIAAGKPLTEQEQALQAITGGTDPFIEETAPAVIPPTLTAEQAMATATAKVAAVQQQEQEAVKKPSKIAKSIETKSVEAGLTKGFADLAGYDAITIKEQSERAIAAIDADIQEVRSILRGEKELPSGLKGTALIKAVEDYIIKNPDADLAYELANSPLITGTSEAAQELRLAAERDPDSATSKIQEIKKAREEKAGKGKTARAKRTVKALVEATKKVNLSKEDLQWDNFLDSITC